VYGGLVPTPCFVWAAPDSSTSNRRFASGKTAGASRPPRAGRWGKLRGWDYDKTRARCRLCGRRVGFHPTDSPKLAAKMVGWNPTLQGDSSSHPTIP